VRRAQQLEVPQVLQGNIVRALEPGAFLRRDELVAPGIERRDGGCVTGKPLQPFGAAQHLAGPARRKAAREQAAVVRRAERHDPRRARRSAEARDPAARDQSTHAVGDDDRALRAGCAAGLFHALGELAREALHASERRPEVQREEIRHPLSLEAREHPMPHARVAQDAVHEHDGQHAGDNARGVARRNPALREQAEGVDVDQGMELLRQQARPAGHAGLQVQAREQRGAQAEEHGEREHDAHPKRNTVGLHKPARRGGVERQLGDELAEYRQRDQVRGGVRRRRGSGLVRRTW
jgi:hypothetical protein